MFKVGDKVKALNQLVIQYDIYTGAIESAIPAGEIGVIRQIENHPKGVPEHCWSGHIVCFDNYDRAYPCFKHELESVA